MSWCNSVLADHLAHFLDDQVDVALRIGPLPDSNLIATRLGAVRRVVSASPDYPSAHGTPVVPEELTRHSVISFEDVTSPGSWAFEHNGAELNVSFRSRLSVNTIDAAIVAGASRARGSSARCRTRLLTTCVAGGSRSSWPHSEIGAAPGAPGLRQVGPVAAEVAGVRGLRGAAAAETVAGAEL